MDNSDDNESERELYCAMAAARRDNAQLWLSKRATRARIWGPENARHSAEWSTDRSHLPLEYNLIEKR